METPKNAPPRTARQKVRSILRPYGDMNDKMLDYFETVSNMKLGEVFDQLEITFHSVSNPAEYLDKHGLPCEKEDAYYIWVSTGISVERSSGQNEKLYIGFAKSTYEDRPGYFCYYIAPRYILEKNASNFLDSSTREEDAKQSMLSDLYDMLLIKSDWAALSDYKVLNELLRLNEAKIANDEKAGSAGKNCLYNKDKTKVAYNPGLISIYGNDIIIIADLDSCGEIVNRKIAQSKTQMKQEGFETVEISPVSFYQSRHDLIFSATADDFDLDDFGRMRHIIEHRRERFPEETKDMPDDELFNKIRSSLEFDLKMTARNPYWAAPFYNIKQDEIQYLLPLFMGSLSEEPDLAMVVGKGEHYYEVRTVLPLKLAYANAACLVSPPSTWLRDATK